MQRCSSRHLALIAVLTTTAACNRDVLVAAPSEASEGEGGADGRGPDQQPVDEPEGEPNRPCRPGAVSACYPGTEATRNVGACREGTRQCGPDRRWGPCIGSVTPTAEVCDGIDNDCDTGTDEGLGVWSCGEGACLHHVLRCVDGVEQSPQSCDPRIDVPEVCGDRVDNDCDGLAPPCYVSYTTGTSVRERPVDVVWAIDSSGSMSVEMATTEANVNRFAAALQSEALSSTLHLITDRGEGDFEICVEPPLGGPACGDNPPHFYQYDTNGDVDGEEMVHSSNALGRIMQQHATWGPRLRSGSHVAFVITTDDDGDDPLWRAPQDPSELNDCMSANDIDDLTVDNDCRWTDPATGVQYTSLAGDLEGLAGFITFMSHKFPNALPGRDWTVYPIIGATGDNGLPPELQFSCATAVEPGSEYVKLALLTGTEDAMVPICDATWDLVDLASAIINHVPQTVFVLGDDAGCAHIDAATLRVRVNGVLLDGGDWTYDAASCVLRIVAHVPNIGDSVEVSFELR